MGGGRKGVSTSVIAIGIVVAIIIIAGVIAAFMMWGGGAPTSTTTFSSSPTKPSASTTGEMSGELTILVPTGDPTLMPYIKMVADDFMAKYPGVKITLQPTPFGQMVTTALTALKNKNPSPGIIIFYPSQASTLGPFLLDLTKYYDSGVINRSDIPQSEMLPVYLLDKNGNIKKIFGVPFQQVFGYALVYRLDIFNNETLQQEFKARYGFDFNPLKWKSWEQLIKAAEFIQSKHLTKYALLFPNGLQQSIFNTFTGIFFTYALNDSCVELPTSGGKLPTYGYWTYFKYSSDGRLIPTLNCSSAIKALETYKELIQFEPPIDQQAMEYPQLRDLFPTGEFAMGAAWTSFIPIYNNESLSKVAGNVGVAPLPGGEFPYATGQAPTFIGINPYVPNHDLAVKFIAFLMTPEEYRKGAEKFGFIPATFSGLDEAAQIPKTAWVKPFTKILQNTGIVDLKRQAAVNSVINFFTDLKPVFINQVAKYFRGQQTAQQAMNNIVKEWLVLMKVSPS
ncbi:MAG: extracellular solute-binding protein [Desulfurococcales archaeon]|nr:extracellular solute-binding protein [Desulfurococcales archaeon]